MKIRIAKKLMRLPLDIHKKPSECTPYHDGQWQAANKRYRQAFKAWKHFDPSMESKFKWEPKNLAPETSK